VGTERLRFMRWKNDKKKMLMDRCIAELREDKGLPKDRWMDYLVGAHGTALKKWNLKPEEVVAKLEKQDAMKLKARKFDFTKV
jgi:hypothetical protein